MLEIFNWFNLNVSDLNDRVSQTRNSASFSFADTLGALFFGASLIVFYLTFKHIGRSELSRSRKALIYAVISLLSIFGIFGYALEVYECSLYTGIRLYPLPLKPDNAIVTASMIATHGHLVPRLQSFIVVFTGWVAAVILALRAYLLIGRIRWFGILLATLLAAMFLVQLILFSIGFNSAWPSYPIINLVLQIPITLAVLYHACTDAPEFKYTVLCIIENVLVDSGAFLTVCLILHTVFPFVGIGFEPMVSLLPHVQNITVCMVLTRLIDGQGVGGVLVLSGEEILGASDIGGSPSSSV